MDPLAPSDYLAHLSADSSRFRAVLADVDPTSRVPGCPEWDATDLLWHLTEVQGFWAAVVTGRPGGPPEDWAPPRPTSHADVLSAFDTASGELLTSLREADPSEPAWHWSPVQTVGTSYRRQAHEALIHRLDAEQTAGLVTALDPTLAADGVAEALDIMYGGAPPAWGSFTPGAGHLRLDLTDVDQQLWVRPGTIGGTDPDSGRELGGPHLLLVEDPGLAPEATVAGTAAALDAWLWKRRDAEDAPPVVRDGDPTVLAAFDAAIDPPLD